MKKDKKGKPWPLSFIEEAWICRTGAISQGISVKRRQVRGERESDHVRKEEWKMKKVTKNTCTPMHNKIEKPRKAFSEKWIAREVMIRIKILKNMSESLEKKENPVLGPFSFF